IIDGEIGEDDKKSGTEKLSNRIILSDVIDKFTGYKKYVTQDKVKLLSLTGTIEAREGSLPEAIGAIRDKANGDFEAAKKDSKEAKAFHEWHSAVKQNLKALSDAFSKKGMEVKTALQKLKDEKIGKQLHGVSVRSGTLQKIYNDMVTILREHFDPVIKSTTKLMRVDADRFKHECTQSLTQHVNTESQQAMDKLINQARKLCISSMKSSLEQFSGKVTEELKPLPTLIDTDRRHGFKGFMRTLEGTIGDDGGTTDENIARLKGLVGQLSGHVKHKDTFQNLSQKFKQFWHPLHDYLKEETKRVHAANNEKINPKPSGEEQLYTSKLDAAHSALNKLLDHISNHRYNHEVPAMLDSLSTKVDGLHPKTFNEPSTPLLDGVGEGLREFAAELGKAYINRYDGGKTIKRWTHRETGDVELTVGGRNGAKIFLSLLAILYHDLLKLRSECRGLSAHQINKSTDVGRLFAELGFKVSEKNQQNGELHDHRNKIGDYVFKRIMWPMKKADENEHLKGCESKKHDRYNNFHIFDLLNCIYSHFEQYNEVCHIATSSARRQPCSVYEMLVWLTGLPYTSVYGTMRDITLSEFFEDSTKQVAAEIEGIEMTLTDIGAVPIQACPRDITYNKVTKAITHICAKAYDVLASIAGHGDEYTLYASDYCNNSLGLKYPSSGQECLDMLLDVLRRCLPALRYIFYRCNVTAEHHGWRNCEYGKDVPTSKSHCSNSATGQVTGQPTCEAKCQPTSPLMSYLNDCLPGHLPHNVSSIGCRSVCSNCPSAAKLGMPCLTPMGFRGFSGSTKSGADLCEIIREFLGSGLVASLFCLVPTPPKTLPEHFGFALSLVNGWVNITNLTPEKRSEFSFQSSFESRIRDVSLMLYPDSNKLIKTLMRAYGSQAVLHEYCKHPHLVNFTSSDICRYDVADVACAPYLQSLCSGSYEYMAIKHCELYLTWAIYLSWDFWRLLNNLYNDFCNIFCADWGCRGCLRGDTCKKGSHGRTDEKSGNPRCQCPSIVDCKGVSPTLYRYGFSFCDAVKLNDDKYKKKCSDFCSQLNKMLTSQYFKDLFKECDNFIWTIREPFTYMVLALWSLSLFYLICVMVGRLDVLHIRSHLRSPSSHKITAQSLLAAAQVGRLAKISYLQP
ncbi:hypothetical protein, conserved, partial [Babesia bigemina]